MHKSDSTIQYAIEADQLPMSVDLGQRNRDDGVLKQAMPETVENDPPLPTDN